MALNQTASDRYTKRAREKEAIPGEVVHAAGALSAKSPGKMGAMLALEATGPDETTFRLTLPFAG